MAYEIVGPAVLQITFEGILFGQQVMTVFNYLYDDTVPMDGDDAIEAAKDAVNLAVTGLYQRYRECCSESLTSLLQHFQWITPTRYAFRTNIPANREGFNESVALTPNIACVVTRRAELAGRDKVSNLHLPAVPTDSVNSGLLTPGQLDAMQAFGIQSLVPIENGAFLSFVPIAFKRTSPATSARLVNVYPQSTARDMRRRTVGVGS